MTYIILAAGKGEAMYPLTLKYSKTSYRLDSDTTVLQKMVRQIRKMDRNADIIIVIGYKAEIVRKELEEEGVTFVVNPFFEVTNSITSLWFARSYLERDNVTIIHGDVVFDDYIMANHITKPTDRPYVLVDSSKVIPGHYNAVIKDGQVLVMSSKLEKSDASYCCVTKLDAVSCRLLKEEIDSMISNMYNQYYEDSLVQMSMFHDFDLFSVDVAGHEWNGVDPVDDLVAAKQIHMKSDY